MVALQSDEKMLTQRESLGFVVGIKGRYENGGWEKGTFGSGG